MTFLEFRMTKVNIMERPRISIIAAMDEKRGIGKNGDLLFKIPEDFKRMKELSIGHPIIMGRKTYESIGKVLPGRTNIIVTRNPNYVVDGAVILHSVIEALEVAHREEMLKQVQHDNEREIFIFGGGEIFKQIMDRVDKLYLTLVERDFQADTFFPDYSEFNKVVYKKYGEYNGLKYKFLDLER